MQYRTTLLVALISILFFDNVISINGVYEGGGQPKQDGEGLVVEGSNENQGLEFLVRLHLSLFILYKINVIM